MLDRALKRTRPLRLSTRSLVLLGILTAAIARWSLGTTCSLGIGDTTLTCPLGYLQMSLAGRILMPGVLLSIGVIVLLAAFLGRLFCGWICPAGLVKDLFGGNGKQFTEAVNSRRKVHGRVRAPGSPAAAGRNTSNKHVNWRRSSSYAVLGGSLLSSLVFGFPVFCAICPVGLTFGTLFAIKGLFQTGEIGLEFVLFPIVLGVELFVLRSWCQELCPLGALLGILGSRSRVLLPVVRKSRCFAGVGVDCRVCSKVCPESLDLIHEEHRALQEICTRCLECYLECPADAVALTCAARATVEGGCD